MQLQTQRKVVRGPGPAAERRVARPASPAGAAGACVSPESGAAELESRQQGAELRWGAGPELYSSG